ncbi:MAG TPA: hypothetical protein VEN79_03450, partial [Terriglobia bacterium]|nr:hypothetical protein [Terriglobia bacterium]
FHHASAVSEHRARIVATGFTVNQPQPLKIFAPLSSPEASLSTHPSLTLVMSRAQAGQRQPIELRNLT